MIKQFEGSEGNSVRAAEGSGSTQDSFKPSAVWVKPAIERISLKDALKCGNPNMDGPGPYS